MIKNGKTCNEKNRITDRHMKRHDSRKKSETNNYALPVPLISYKGITKPKKAALSFKFVKTQKMSGSQDQKERKTASTLTTIVFEQKNHHSANSLLQLSPTQ